SGQFQNFDNIEYNNREWKRFKRSNQLDDNSVLLQQPGLFSPLAPHTSNGMHQLNFVKLRNGIEQVSDALFDNSRMSQNPRTLNLIDNGTIGRVQRCGNTGAQQQIAPLPHLDHTAQNRGKQMDQAFSGVADILSADQTIVQYKRQLLNHVNYYVRYVDGQRHLGHVAEKRLNVIARAGASGVGAAVGDVQQVATQLFNDVSGDGL
ncbi:hypothetical protein BpHYR1_019066, partial [Brachionus plicatilis]